MEKKWDEIFRKKTAFSYRLGGIGHDHFLLEKKK